MRILIIIFLFVFNISNGQKTYPYLFKDSIGDEYIVLTLEQAQKLDNATEFSPVLFKDNAAYYKLVDSIYHEKIKFAVQEVIDIKEMEITNIKKTYEEKQFMVDQLKWMVDIQKLELSNLEQKYEYGQSILKSKEDTISVLNKTIKLKDDKISKQRKNVNTAIGFGIISAVIAFIVSI